MQLDLRNQSQVYFGLFERELHPWITRLSEGVRCVVDIGAAHGEYSLFALAKTNAERVLAFEPSLEMCQSLRANVAGLPGVSNRFELHQTSLGRSDSHAMTSVNALARQLLAPCLLKMDIDGGEADLLDASSKDLLAIKGLRWIVETHSAALESACISIFSASGYTTRVIRNAWWRSFIPEQRVSEQNRWLIAVNESPSLLSGPRLLA